LGLDATQQQGIQMAGIIHDIGKIHVPLEILTHPGRLTELEMGFVRIHPEICHEIIKDIDFPWPIADMILQHHERLDGSGYPKGLIGDDILLGARVLAVADVYEAMTTMRPYRAALGAELALDELRAGRGRTYDSAVADAAISLLDSESKTKRQ
jgi:HD-GYP domain-containing protein (c-di-GMP phosphodiesterase class II)